jgi:hypothetical protein
MVSPARGDYRRLQAETPLIVLFKLASPALTTIGPKNATAARNRVIATRIWCTASASAARALL